jgi:hypothetical protein
MRSAPVGEVDMPRNPGHFRFDPLADFIASAEFIASSYIALAAIALWKVWLRSNMFCR